MKTTESEVAVLKDHTCEMDRKLDKIMDNHLPHIYEELKALNLEISKLEGKFRYYLGMAIGGLGIVQVIIAILSLWIAIKK